MERPRRLERLMGRAGRAGGRGMAAPLLLLMALVLLAGLMAWWMLTTTAGPGALPGAPRPPPGEGGVGVAVAHPGEEETLDAADLATGSETRVSGPPAPSTPAPGPEDPPAPDSSAVTPDAAPSDGPEVVERILERLLRFQDGDGGWRTGDAAWGRRGATALAILFLLGKGVTPGSETPASEALGRALEFLHRGEADATASPLAEPAVALALGETRALTGADPELAQGHLQSLRLVLAAQREDGGWASGAEGGSDVGVSGLAVMALRSASLGGAPPDCDGLPEAMASALTWFREQRQALADVPPGVTVSAEQLTAASSLISLVLLGEPGDREGLDHAAALLVAAPPGSVDYLQTYFTTLSLYQVGGTAWRDWSRTLRERLAGGLPADPVEAALTGLSAEIQYRYVRLLR